MFVNFEGTMSIQIRIRVDDYMPLVLSKTVQQRRRGDRANFGLRTSLSTAYTATRFPLPSLVTSFVLLSLILFPFLKVNLRIKLPEYIEHGEQTSFLFYLILEPSALSYPSCQGNKPLCSSRALTKPEVTCTLTWKLYALCNTSGYRPSIRKQLRSGFFMEHMVLRVNYPEYLRTAHIHSLMEV